MGHATSRKQATRRAEQAVRAARREAVTGRPVCLNLLARDLPVMPPWGEAVPNASDPE